MALSDSITIDVTVEPADEAFLTIFSPGEILAKRALEVTVAMGAPPELASAQSRIAEYLFRTRGFIEVYTTAAIAVSPEILGIALEDSKLLVDANAHGFPEGLHLVKVCLTCRPAFRCPAHVHLATAKASPPAPVAAAPLPRECACGIARVDCDYHRA